MSLRRGKVEVRLVDSDGFDGRCAGVVLAKGEGAPTLPLAPKGDVETVEADFVVVGGGLPGEYAKDGADSIRIGLYNHDIGKYLIPFSDLKIPKSFWERDKYKLFRMGVSAYAPRTIVIWTDTRGSCVLGSSPLDTQLLSRLYDSVNTDRQFETWISIKAQGPMFFDGDTRENRIFIEQMFSVEL